jgi:DNA-binding winged helix-turn-helix (wHTH) protein/tetratricopeptide (TPR) repeat protein
MGRPTRSYAFGSFLLDATAYQLMADGRPIGLSPKALDLLFLFAGRPGELVTKDDILAALWPDVAVTDNALTQVVSEIRQALGDSPSWPRFVQTVPRRGYRFVGALAPQVPRASALSPAGDTVRPVVVADFVNHSREASLDWLSAGMAESIANGLRVVRTLRLIDRSARQASGALGPADAVVISGGFQRMGSQLRITAEAVDRMTGRPLGHAKADGELADVFGLQDAIVTQLAASLPQREARSGPRPRPRETASLDAYRALTEGRLRLETLDPGAVAEAIRDFDRALALHADYALAHAGLAHAHLWTFQASRVASHPDQTALASAIAHARRAVDLDPELAEGHAALAFLLASAGRPREAVEAGRVATALEPANWRHQFRLGVAAWGDERLDAFGAVLAVYPRLAYAHFGIAMVHVARADLASAERILRAGIAESPVSVDARFPGGGLHWLLGLVRLAVGDVTEAVVEFDRELSAGQSLFTAEFAMDAEDAHGFVCVAAGDWRRAAAHFSRALSRVPDHARSLVGLAASHRGAGQEAEAANLDARVEAAIARLHDQGRTADAAMAAACQSALAARPAEAIATLEALLESAPPGFAGWTIPIEPAFAACRSEATFGAVLTRLAARAR